MAPCRMVLYIYILPPLREIRSVCVQRCTATSPRPRTTKRMPDSRSAASKYSRNNPQATNSYGYPSYYARSLVVAWGVGRDSRGCAWGVRVLAGNTKFSLEHPSKLTTLSLMSLLEQYTIADTTPWRWLHVPPSHVAHCKSPFVLTPKIRTTVGNHITRNTKKICGRAVWWQLV